MEKMKVAAAAGPPGCGGRSRDHLASQVISNRRSPDPCCCCRPVRGHPCRSGLIESHYHLQRAAINSQPSQVSQLPSSAFQDCFNERSCFRQWLGYTHMMHSLTASMYHIILGSLLQISKEYNITCDIYLYTHYIHFCRHCMLQCSIYFTVKFQISLPVTW